MNEDEFGRMVGRTAWGATKLIGKASFLGGKKAFDLITDKKGKERAAREQREREIREYIARKNAYRQSIAPTGAPYAFADINIAEDDKILLGLDNVQLPYRCPIVFVNRNNKLIAFPESRYGMTRLYYLFDIDFEKKEYYETRSHNDYHSETNINSTTRGNFNFVGGGGGTASPSYFNSTQFGFGFSGGGNSSSFTNSHSSTNGYSNGYSIQEKKERYTSAIFTFVQSDNKMNNFNVRVDHIASDAVNGYKHYFLLSDIDKKNLNLI